MEVTEASRVRQLDIFAISIQNKQQYGKDISRVLTGSWAVWISRNAHEVKSFHFHARCCRFWEKNAI